MGGFIVERYWPGVTEADVRLVGAVLRQVGGPTVTYLGSILIPGDEVVLCRFEAATPAQVKAVSELAGLRCDRLVAAVFVDPAG